MKRLTAEPLLHFLVLGALLFGAYGLRGSDAAPGRGTIVVSAAQIESLAAAFERTWGRPPGPREREGLVAEHVREEVFYREALALGLDRDDAIVRRRLRQKLEFLAEGLAAAGEPSDADLAAHLRAHPERFAVEGRVSFVQEPWPTRPATAGVRAATLLPGRFEDAPWSEVERQFGPAFAEALRRLPLGRWEGPVPSGFGERRVRIAARSEARTAALDEVRDAVRGDWADARRAEAGERFYRSLRERWDVRVEAPEAAAAGRLAAAR